MTGTAVLVAERISGGDHRECQAFFEGARTIPFGSNLSRVEVHGFTDDFEICRETCEWLFVLSFFPEASGMAWTGEMQWRPPGPRVPEIENLPELENLCLEDKALNDAATSRSNRQVTEGLSFGKPKGDGEAYKLRLPEPSSMTGSVRLRWYVQVNPDQLDCEYWQQDITTVEGFDESAQTKISFATVELNTTEFLGCPSYQEPSCLRYVYMQFLPDGKDFRYWASLTVSFSCDAINEDSPYGNGCRKD